MIRRPITQRRAVLEHLDNVTAKLNAERRLNTARARYIAAMNRNDGLTHREIDAECRGLLREWIAAAAAERDARAALEQTR
jgi:hypothetical protein